MPHIDEINHLADLASVRHAWDDLLTQTPGATFFQSLDWLEVYWRNLGAGQKLRVLVVSDSARPLGIVPLTVLPEWRRVGTMRILTYPLAHWGSFYGPIGPDPATALDAAWRHVRRTRRDWDIAEPRFIAPESLAGMQSAMDRAGLPATPSELDQTAIIDLPPTWDDYLASRTSKWRNNFRRWERRLGEKGKITHVRHRPAGGLDDPRWDLYDACEAIARRSWQGASADGTTLSHESVRPFLRDMHAAAARAGGVDVNLLLLDGNPLAFAYNYHYHGHVFGLRIGCDTALANDGVGNLLYARVIADSIARGDHTYDLGPGSIEAKRHLLSRVSPIMRLSHFHPRSPRAQLIRLKRWLAARKDSIESQRPAADDAKTPADEQEPAMA